MHLEWSRIMGLNDQNSNDSNDYSKYSGDSDNVVMRVISDDSDSIV